MGVNTWVSHAVAVLKTVASGVGGISVLIAVGAIVLEAPGVPLAAVVAAGSGVFEAGGNSGVSVGGAGVSVQSGSP